MLLREEYRWARDLDRADPNAKLAGQPPAQAIAITISVNGIQQQTFTLGDAPNFNVGIINPIVLPGLSNCFKVTLRFVSAQGQDLGDASKAVVVTQLVLDDGVIAVPVGHL